MCTASLTKPREKFMTVCSWRFGVELETAVEAQMFPKELNTRRRVYFIKNFILIFFLITFCTTV